MNERDYGELTGLNKDDARKKWGEEQVHIWRRSFDVPPPPLDDASEWSQVGDPRYAGIDGEVPRTESLSLVIDRLLPYWEGEIVPDLRASGVFSGALDPHGSRKRDEA